MTERVAPTPEAIYSAHKAESLIYSLGTARARQYYEEDISGYQQEALGLAEAAGINLNLPRPGLFDVALNVQVTSKPEKITVKVPDGCIQKDDVVALARRFGTNLNSLSIAWTRLHQRSAHSVKIPPSGPTPETDAEIEKVEQAGITLYKKSWSSTGEITYYYYSFQDDKGRDIELWKLPEGVEEDSPFADTERFLIAEAFIKAVDQGWLEKVHDEDKVQYPDGLGPKYKRLLYRVADHYRQVLGLEGQTEDEKVSLGYGDRQDLEQFAQANGHHKRQAIKIDGKINGLAAEDGTIDERLANEGAHPPYTPDEPDGSPNEQKRIELINPDGKYNLDTLKRLYLSGFCHRYWSIGAKGEEFLWGFLEERRKQVNSDQALSETLA